MHKMEKFYRLKLFLDRLRYCREKHFYLMVAAFLVVLLAVFSGLYLKMKADLKTKDNILESYCDPQDASTAMVTVYICGRVARAGVYEVEAGARVSDVLAMAGGPGKDAGLEAINLARKVIDEEKIFIPAAGQSQGSSLISINSASSQLLQTLPGIGPATAQKIVDYRQQQGPFNTVEDLKKVAGIGDKKFQDIKDLISI